MLLQRILLMVRFREVEAGERGNLRVDFPFRFRGDAVPALQLQALLLFAVEEYNRPVRSRPGSSSWIVTFPEHFEQSLVRYLCGVEVYLDRLRMIAPGVVRGIHGRFPRIPNPGPHNSVDASDPGIWTPESAHCKGRRLRPGGCSGIYGWHGLAC